MITLYIVLWFLSGYLSAIFGRIVFDRALTVGDLFGAICAGIFGPLLTIFVLVFYLKETGFFDFDLYQYFTKGKS